MVGPSNNDGEWGRKWGYTISSSAEWGYHLLTSCFPPRSQKSDTYMPRTCDERACLAALPAVLLPASQPVCQLPRGPSHSRAPKLHTCPYIFYSALWTMGSSFNLVPSAFSAFRIPQKCLTHEGHSVVVNFLNKSSVISRCEDWGQIERSRYVISLPLHPPWVLSSLSHYDLLANQILA